MPLFHIILMKGEQNEMAVSNRLYELRKKEGLSQEQLAEKLGVSRQAVSKWESEQSFPEYEKLVSISNFFNVSLDYLMKDDEEINFENKTRICDTKSCREKRIAGTVLCVGGILCLIVWGIVSFFNPAVSNQIQASSTIEIDGNGIFFIIALASALFGAILLLKNNSKK